MAKALRVMRQDFQQEMHCCGEHDAPKLPEDVGSLVMRYEDGGGGEYVVLSAYEWSFDDEAEVDDLAERIKAMIRAAAE